MCQVGWNHKLAILGPLGHLDLALKSAILLNKTAKVLFSVVISDAIFSARSLFDDLNGSKHIGTSHWNLKNTLGKTVQYIFKSAATWSLKEKN